ncbi:imelysin family protein [Spirosoma sp. SC4-14]|uniref:imelysin family protein n=1 Tax=Spirosoma sp. SC4-14 TaxID=3128900 RepID=UPI0030D19748
MSLRYIWSCLLILATTGVLILACSSPGEDMNTGTQFDRKAMLQQYADNLIRPAFQLLQANTTLLNTTVDAFVSAPTADKLATLQTVWLATHTSFQAANAYNFGPAGESGSRMALVQEIGTFPVSTTKIEATIPKGTYTLTDANYDARGLLAIEYLIFDVSGDNSRILSSLQSVNRQAYLKALATNVKQRVDDVVTGWDTYVTTFVSSNGTEAGSSTSELYNEFIRSYESIKNYKVGLPLGARAGQTAPQPNLAEGYYSNQSLTFINAHLNAIENIWRGKSADKDGIGFQEYLQQVEGGPALIANTEAELAQIHRALEALNGKTSLTQQITTNKSAVDALYTELQKNTRYFKSDMSSLLGIAITFSSGDGD